jgi:hypothetical protein
MSRVESVSNYIEEHWSQTGIEVGARGACGWVGGGRWVNTTCSRWLCLFAGVRSLTLKLPPDVTDLSELVIELWNEFSCRVELKHIDASSGAQLTLWIPTHDQSKPPPPLYQRPWRILAIGLAALVAGGAATFYDAAVQRKLFDV